MLEDIEQLVIENSLNYFHTDLTDCYLPIGFKLNRYKHLASSAASTRVYLRMTLGEAVG